MYYVLSIISYLTSRFFEVTVDAVSFLRFIVGVRICADPWSIARCATQKTKYRQLSFMGRLGSDPYETERAFSYKIMHRKRLDFLSGTKSAPTV